jgi:hypothetical protein
MHALTCDLCMTDNTGVVMSNQTLQLRDTAPQLELLQPNGWYVVHHPCSWNQLLTSTATPVRQHSVFMSASPLIAS